MLNFFTYFLLFLFSSSSAYAYIDPGTGSIILQAIMGFIALVFTGASIYWNKLKTYIKKIFTKDKSKKDLIIKK